jgi:hypothetical protein
VSGSVASFNSDYNKIPVNSLICNIEPIQSGTGDPSPDNVRPISGRTGLTVSHSGADTSDPITVSVNWETEAGTVYGGTLDVVSGKLVVDRAYAELTKDSEWSWNAGNSLAICPVRNAIIVNTSIQTIVFANNNLFTPSAWVGRNTPEYSCGLMYGAS